jgi:uncharacterized LabA/DUF88 family protein
MSEKIRIRIFIDFWNFQLNWNDLFAAEGETVQIPWKDIPNILSAEAAKGQPFKFVGARVYASVDPLNARDKGLNNWLHHTLASYAGYSIDVKERKPRKKIRCHFDDCREEISTCPKCNRQLKGTVEKGIDAAIITDLMAFAFDDTYDIGIIISGDADFSPAVQYIQKKTDKQIIQAFFKSHGDQLRVACWDHIFFDDLVPKLPISQST